MHGHVLNCPTNAIQVESGVGCASTMIITALIGGKEFLVVADTSFRKGGEARKELYILNDCDARTLLRGLIGFIYNLFVLRIKNYNLRRKNDSNPNPHP